MGDIPAQRPVPYQHPEHGPGMWVPAAGMEYLDAIKAEKTAKPKQLPYTDRRAIVFFPGIRRLLRHDEFTRIDFRVLFAVILTSNHEDTDWHVDMPAIEKLLGVRRTSIERSIRKFTDTGLLHRTGRGRLAYDWSFLWRNGSTSREIAKRRAQRGGDTNAQE